MPLYLAVDTATGKRLRQSIVAQKDVEPIGKTESLRILSHIDIEPDESRQAYDAIAGDFVDLAPTDHAKPAVVTREELQALEATLTAALASVTAVLASPIRGGGVHA